MILPENRPFWAFRGMANKNKSRAKLRILLVEYILFIRSIGNPINVGF